MYNSGLDNDASTLPQVVITLSTFVIGLQMCSREFAINTPAPLPFDVDSNHSALVSCSYTHHSPLYLDTFIKHFDNDNNDHQRLRHTRHQHGTPTKLHDTIRHTASTNMVAISNHLVHVLTPSRSRPPPG